MFNFPAKNSFSINKSLLPFILFVSFFGNTYAQQAKSNEDSLVQKFYILNQQQLYWLSSAKNIKRAVNWLSIIASNENSGLVSNKPEFDQFRTSFYKSPILDSSFIAATDRKITLIILRFIRDLQQGNVFFDYDEVAIPHDSLYISQVLNSGKKRSVSKLIASLDCKDKDYLLFKKFLNDSITKMDTLKYKSLLLAMNYRRYLTFNHHDEYILVNIPAAEAEYYKNVSLILKMRTVVGRKKNPTPTIASYITNIVFFPDWNVPFSIAVKEILPKVQLNENYLEQHNFEVVDAKGNIIEDSELNWKDYNENYFPFYFRQSTGTTNALGVLKFNMQNPFSIFLHATSWQGVFAKDDRFLSHGCIRLEKPFELADSILKGKIDIEEFKIRKKTTEPTMLKLPKKIPVFIVYMPVLIVDNNVVFLQDVYGLLK